MKAIVCTKYGSPYVLQLKEVAKPTPKDNEALVKVHAAALNAADFEILRGESRKPKHKIHGSDIAGRIEAVGRNVKQFQPSDEIWGDLSLCGFGTFAEYVCAPENALRLKPDSMTFEEAAAIPNHPSYKHHLSHRDYFSKIAAGIYSLEYQYQQKNASPGEVDLLDTESPINMPVVEDDR